jgi:hypothetical protein
MRAIFSGLVVRAITAMKGSPSSWEKYASETAVLPLEASTMVLSSLIQPLTRPNRNRDRANRCLRLPDL